MPDIPPADAIGERHLGNVLAGFLSSFLLNNLKMFKITAIISLVLIGSTMWASSLSCDSCGSECASACGTRHFRSCCFNYLRRKRGTEALKFLTSPHDMKPDSSKPDKSKLPVYVVESLPELWISNIIDKEFKYPEDIEQYDF